MSGQPYTGHCDHMLHTHMYLHAWTLVLPSHQYCCTWVDIIMEGDIHTIHTYAYGIFTNTVGSLHTFVAHVMRIYVWQQLYLSTLNGLYSKHGFY